MIQTELKKYSLADEVADWLIAEVQKEKSRNDKLLENQTSKLIRK